MTEGRADVEILGQRLSVRGRGTPEYIHELADYLNGRIQAVRDQARVFDPRACRSWPGSTSWTSSTGAGRRRACGKRTASSRPGWSASPSAWGLSWTAARRLDGDRRPEA